MQQGVGLSGIAGAYRMFIQESDGLQYIIANPQTSKSPACEGARVRVSVVPVYARTHACNYNEEHHPKNTWVIQCQ